MIRKLVDWLYFKSAMWMPMAFAWQRQYNMSARMYFENNESPYFRGWPWSWRMDWPENEND